MTLETDGKEQGATAPTVTDISGTEGGAAVDATARLRPSDRRRGRFGLLLILTLPVIAAAVLFAILIVTHRPIPAPRWIVDKVEARANAALEGRLRLRLLGGIELYVDDTLHPRLRARMVEIDRPSGQPMAVLPELRVTLASEPLMNGKILPAALVVRGASLSLHRLPDGRLDLDLGGGDMTGKVAPDNAAAALAAFKQVLDVPALSQLRKVQAEDVQLRLMDERLDRIWRVSKGRLSLTQDANQISASLGFEIDDRAERPARISVSMTTLKSGPQTSFGAAITDLPARDLAVQSPALAPLGLLDAPISGSLRSGLDAQGKLTDMNGVLEIGAGWIAPGQGVASIPLKRGKFYLSYDRARQRIALSDLEIDSRAVRLKASGQMFLRDLKGGLPRKLLGQIAISDLQLDPQGLFETPANFKQGAADLRISLDPFRVDLGQLELTDGTSTIAAKGQAAALPTGWNIALDASIDKIDKETLLRLWPPALVDKTREWVEKNITTGQLRRVRAALRLDPGTEPKLALGYEFRGADVKVMPTLPPIQQGRGFSTIIGIRQALKVEEGHVTAPSGGRIEVADSEMIVPDIRIMPAPAVVKLITRSPIPAALSLLDQPPFEFLSKAGLGTDIAKGWAQTRAVLKLPLDEHVPAEDISFDVRARLTDVVSDKLVPGRELRADALSLSADQGGLTIGGKGTLSGVPFDATWEQPFGPDQKGESHVSGTIDVNPEALAAFGIGLPKGMVSGAGTGKITLDLAKDRPIRFAFESDLAGIGLKIPEIGWSLPAKTTGMIALNGTLGDPPAVDRLSLTAPGLQATGDVSLHHGGALDRARFTDLAIGKWFSGSVDLVGRGATRPPDVQVNSGRLDLASAQFGPAVQAGGGPGNAITVALDQVQVAKGIALTGFRGNLSTKGGVSGRFQGRVNGQAPVTGTLVPAKDGRVSVRVQTQDAGAVLAAAGIFDKARGGAGTLTLTPYQQKSYDGQVHIADLKVKDAPVLASMLSAASGVGLLEQLSGEGIPFSDVEGSFRLTPNGVSVTRGAAVGASLGVTMAGNYYPDGERLEMKGVISPFYMINGIGQIFAKKGEGLFGFSYSLRGTAEDPKVSIDPLSILTPGAMRELFHAAPPKVLSE